MCQKRPDVDVALRDSVFLLARVVNDGDQPVAILANVEDHVSIHIIGIFEDLPYFNEISPPRRACDSVPGPNLPGCFRILFFGLDQVLACDNVHEGLPKSSAAGVATATVATFSIYFAKCKVVKGKFSFLKVNVVFDGR
jgi:hypothetical protein